MKLSITLLLACTLICYAHVATAQLRYAMPKDSLLINKSYSYLTPNKAIVNLNTTKNKVDKPSAYKKYQHNAANIKFNKPAIIGTTKIGTLYALPLDNMPCLVPYKITGSEHYKLYLKTTPYLTLPQKIPNPLYR